MEKGEGHFSEAMFRESGPRTSQSGPSRPKKGGLKGSPFWVRNEAEGPGLAGHPVEQEQMLMKPLQDECRAATWAWLEPTHLLRACTRDQAEGAQATTAGKLRQNEPASGHETGCAGGEWNSTGICGEADGEALDSSDDCLWPEEARTRAGIATTGPTEAATHCPGRGVDEVLMELAESCVVEQRSEATLLERSSRQR